MELESKDDTGYNFDRANRKAILTYMIVVLGMTDEEILSKTGKMFTNDLMQVGKLTNWVDIGKQIRSAYLGIDPYLDRYPGAALHKLYTMYDIPNEHRLIPDLYFDVIDSDDSDDSNSSDDEDNL